MAKQILVVDDSSFMRDRIKKVLTESGYNIIGEAKDGAEAISKYSELKPDFVTMDITMRGMNGLEASRQILADDSQAKIVIISVTENEEYQKEASSIGIKSYLQKNKLETLPEILKEIES